MYALRRGMSRRRAGNRWGLWRTSRCAQMPNLHPFLPLRHSTLFPLVFSLVYCNIYSLFPFTLRHSSSNVTNPACPWITPAHCSDVPSVHGSRGSLPCVHPCDAGFFSQYFSRFNFPKYLSKKERVINAKRQRDLLLAVFRLFHLLD